MTQLQTSYKEHDMWVSWPDEILIEIFSYLDMKSLKNCMQVNQQWRDVTEYCCQHFNLWEKFFEEVIDYSPLKFKEKSTLNFKDQLEIAQQWHNIKDSNISFRFHYTSTLISNICVQKDNLIVVSNKAIKHYDINCNRPLKSTRASSRKYEETHALSAELSAVVDNDMGNLLILINKLHKSDCKCTKGKNMIACRAHIIRVHSNSCYVIDGFNNLRVFRADYCAWHNSYLAKYYGSKSLLLDINIYKDNIYVLLTKGNVLYLNMEYRNLENISYFCTDLSDATTKPIMFHSFSIIRAAFCEEKMQIVSSDKNGQVAVICPRMTYALEHGPVVLIAYKGGKIEIYLTKNLLNNITTPELSFNLKTYLQVPENEYEILNMDVYEGADGHHLFVATRTDIYEFILSVNCFF